MSRKKVSIVIPTYNRVDFVEKSIRSALEQTYPCDVIVCDHGSTDGTVDLLKKYPGINYIRREKDLGPHFCWLEGILNADTKYIHLQYDDDWVATNYVEKTISLLKEEVGFVFGNVQIYNQQDGSYSECFQMKKLGYTTGVYSNDEFYTMALKGNLMISPGACLFRKNDMVDALYQGRLPFGNSNDYHGVGPDFFMTLITLLRYKKFGFVEEDIVFFRAHDGSITIDASNSDEKNKKIKLAYEDVRTYCKLLLLFKNNNSVRRKVTSAKNPLKKLVMKKMKRVFNSQK